MSSTGIKSRLSHAQWTLKPQDLAMAFKLVCISGRRLPYAILAQALHMSPFEAHACIARLAGSRLLSEPEGIPQLAMSAFRPFVLMGAPYFFPAVRGGVTVGYATAYGIDPIKTAMLFADDLMPPVWPHPDGPDQGFSLLPLYPKLPLAAKADPPFYELLALFDAVRIGQARERELARGMLEERLA